MTLSCGNIIANGQMKIKVNTPRALTDSDKLNLWASGTGDVEATIGIGGLTGAIVYNGGLKLNNQIYAYHRAS